ncbi:MAG: DUF2975 domain-containing protein [Firmicutes bacterium]|nr:DUF2975 domain-containing protein [Bacillota bacterium]
MNSKTLSNFHKFGKVGKIAMTVLMVIAILATAVSLAATIFVASLPKDALTVRVTNNAEFRINEKNFDSLWGILVDSFSYAGDTSPEEMLSDESDKITPPENQDFNTELSFFNQSYSSAKIYSDGNTKVMEAKSSPAEYRSTDLVSVLIFLTLFVASVAAALYMLKRLFAVLAKCDSPFCDELVKRMKAFGFSLLPVAIFATVGETLSTAFLSAGRDVGISIQWGVLIAFAVTMCLVTVFKYGVRLQKESDETL